MKKLLFYLTFNLSLFLVLMIGIQNSSDKKKVAFLKSETVPLPVSFIAGMSFITGSLTGAIMSTNLGSKQQ